MIMVSSCLLGIHSKYDGTNTNTNDLLMRYINLGKYIPICPEQIGGLSTPRRPSEIVNGTGEDVLIGKANVQNNIGDDVTIQFKEGAEQVLYMIKNMPIKAAILKERSPSCGSHKIYDGTFQKNIINGKGVAAAMLSQNNIPIYSEEEITDELLRTLLEV